MFGGGVPRYTLQHFIADPPLRSSNGWVVRILVPSVGNVSKARSVASRRPLTGSLRPVLAGGATMTMTTMTTFLFLVVVVEGEGPTIRLLELARVLGQPSPHGISEVLVSQKPITCVTIYRSHMYDAWIFYAFPSSWRGCMFSFASFFRTVVACESFSPSSLLHLHNLGPSPQAEAIPYGDPYLSVVLPRRAPCHCRLP